MADRYTSINMVLTYGGTTIGTNGRTVEIDPKAAEPDIHDDTVAGASTRSEQLGLLGATRTKLTLSGLDGTKGALPILDLTVNDKQDLVFYPEGNTATYESITIADAIFLGVSRGFNIEGLSTFAAEWIALGGPAYEAVAG